ncbi:GNAT family protein [Bacillus carboniphilus]|uniref:GNAT family protein n=1 Tax=Bacillus carboniphilus TaxID=86663 RepID=A0ABY9JWD0_9BACI|nr:GNAT family protein [Bacillus carboniphilus]WLR43109.1 GNAT family protein [Bacillus carboniphilus]
MVRLQGEQVVLRNFKDEDLDILYYWRFEDLNQEAKKWNGPYIKERWMSKEEFSKKWGPKDQISPGVYDQLIIEVEGKVIGTFSCYWIDQNTNWLETGIVIYDPQYWSGGYGTDAYRLWIDYLFNETSIHRLGMSTWSGNIRMLKVASKIGMKEEARIREAREVNGVLYDAIKMGILRKEWTALK